MGSSQTPDYALFPRLLANVSVESAKCSGRGQSWTVSSDVLDPHSKEVRAVGL